MIPAQDAWATALANKSRRYPTKEDVRFQNGMIFPQIKPRWTFDWPNTNVFTIGSCFARNIESALLKLGVTVPTQTFNADPAEWIRYSHPAMILNEFSPGTTAQRITRSLQNTASGTDNIVKFRSGYQDQLLHCYDTPVTWDRTLERRADVDRVYSNLKDADLVIITLGLVESWFDVTTGNFLNIAITPRDPEPDRYVFKRLSVADTVELLAPAVRQLTDRGQRVLLTVSPVALVNTFTNSDAVVANEYSKNVLRVACEELLANPMVDYFPSYEIIRSGGSAVYQDDLLHPTDAVIDQVVSYMIRNYTQR
jgi:hypothetical protein